MLCVFYHNKIKKEYLSEGLHNNQEWKKIKNE